MGVVDVVFFVSGDVTESGVQCFEFIAHAGEKKEMEFMKDVNSIGGQ